MTKEDFIRKITSRKFWVALVAFIVSLLVAFNVPEASISQVTAIITAFGSLVTYILVEGHVDSKYAEGDINIYTDDTEETEE